MAGSCQARQHYCMKQFSMKWRRSKKARKQRKYRDNLPLHVRIKLMNAHLSKELRGKYKRRHFPVKKGDKVKILRGQFKKKEGKIERVDRKKERLYIEGIEIVKKEGTKVLMPVHPSNVVVLDLNMSDKKRKERLEGGVKK